jgi:hypothetical protein
MKEIKKDSMNIQPGDKLLHITKYGGKNIIEVELIQNKFDNWDIDAMVVYEAPQIKTTKGAYLNTDGSDGKLYKIKRKLTTAEMIYYQSQIRIKEERFNKEIQRREGNK